MEMNFQKIVLIIAICLLIVALVIISYMMRKNALSVKWPPTTAECPDYWILDGSGSNATCVNVKDLGTCKSVGNQHQTMNFNTSAFTGSQGACNKYNWATKCNVTWDGITYGVNNPCSQ